MRGDIVNLFMLILLDIDGVMVPANSWKRPEFLADGFLCSIQKL